MLWMLGSARRTLLPGGMLQRRQWSCERQWLSQSCLLLERPSSKAVMPACAGVILRRKVSSQAVQFLEALSKMVSGQLIIIERASVMPCDFDRLWRYRLGRWLPSKQPTSPLSSTQTPSLKASYFWQVQKIWEVAQRWRSLKQSVISGCLATDCNKIKAYQWFRVLRWATKSSSLPCALLDLLLPCSIFNILKSGSPQGNQSQSQNKSAREGLLRQQSQLCLIQSKSVSLYISTPQCKFKNRKILGPCRIVKRHCRLAFRSRNGPPVPALIGLDQLNQNYWWSLCYWINGNYYYMEGPQSIPVFPKLYLACSIVFSVLVFTKSLDPYLLTYTFSQTFLELSLWRPITAIFYLGRIGLLFPFQLAFAYLAASKLASKVYQREASADLAWLLLLSVILLAIFSTFINLYFYGNSFVMIMLMMWAMQYPTDTLKVFGADIHSVYVPIVYTALMIVLGSTYRNYMAGFLIGLLLGAVKNPNYIREHGDLFPTPGFLKSFFRYDAQEAERIRMEQVRASQRDYYFQGRSYRLA